MEIIYGKSAENHTVQREERSEQINFNKKKYRDMLVEAAKGERCKDVHSKVLKG